MVGTEEQLPTSVQAWRARRPGRRSGRSGPRRSESGASAAFTSAYLRFAEDGRAHPCLLSEGTTPRRRPGTGPTVKHGGSFPHRVATRCETESMTPGYLVRGVALPGAAGAAGMPSHCWVTLRGRTPSHPRLRALSGRTTVPIRATIGPPVRGLHRPPPAGSRGAGGSPQAAGHVRRVDRPTRAHALPLGDHRQRRRRGAGWVMRPDRGHPAPDGSVEVRDNGRGDTGRHRAAHRPDRGRSRLHQAARGRQVRRRLLHGIRRAARGRRLRGQRPVLPSGRRGRPRAARPTQ